MFNKIIAIISNDLNNSLIKLQQTHFNVNYIQSQQRKQMN